MVRRIESLAEGLVPPMEVDRARALLAELEQQVISSRIAWRVASARSDVHAPSDSGIRRHPLGAAAPAGDADSVPIFP